MRFHKLQGAANDFVVVDGRESEGRDWAAIAARVCDRRRGVGADGLLVLEDSATLDYRMRYHNADGSQAEMCGNGVRCMAKFVLDTGVTDRRQLRWETLAGPISTEVLAHDGEVATVRVDMGPPRFRPDEIPARFDGEEIREAPLTVDGKELRVTAVSMGNPHVVAFVDSVAGYPLEFVGPIVEHHEAFPARTNFEIVEVLSADRIRMRVWERGVGETMACGTGACAAAVASRLVRDTAEEVTLEVPGGELVVSWRPGEPVMMTGPAETAFTGEFLD
jgi:diaminopimelate epimerase